MDHGLRDLEIQAQACIQQPCFSSEWTAAHASKSSTHVQLSVGNFGLPEMQQFCLRVMLLNAANDIGLCSRIEH